MKLQQSILSAAQCQEEGAEDQESFCELLMNLFEVENETDDGI